MLVELIAACALAADPGLGVEPLGLARPDALLRVAVSRPAVDGDPPGPVRLLAELRDGAAVLASTALDLDGLAALDRRVVLVLTTPAIGAGPYRVRVAATWPGGPGLPARSALGEAEVRTPAAALQAATAAIARLRAAGDSDPLPWLWAEQIAELAAGGANAASAGEVSAIAGRLEGWLGGARPAPAWPGCAELALRDAVDGSVQPWRLHVPAGSGPFPVAVLLATAAGQGKARWPAWDRRQVQAALEAGLAVVECHPAGDRRWDGAAARRIAAVLAAAGRLAALDTRRGAVLCAADPPAAPYAVHRPGPAAEDPTWWRAALGPPRPPRSAPATWSDAPFAIVVGTAEHAAAVAANRAIAASLRAAYAAHALAVVDLLDDTIDADRLAGRNLVLIGNPRSNRVLAGLRLALPFTWDHREVSGPDGFRALRATAPALACSTTLPDGRIVLVIDGRAPAWGDGLPLAGLGLPLIQPAP